MIQSTLNFALREIGICIGIVYSCETFSSFGVFSIALEIVLAR
jgi:hypothetical protein